MKTISVHLMGGLGNQLFQIFAAISYCLDNENEYRLLLPYSETLNIGIIRKTYWNNFLSGLKQFTNFTMQDTIPNQLLFTFPCYKETGFPYSPIPKIITDINQMLLFGYFQSYKYFEKNEEKIFNLIQMKEQQEQIKKEYFDNKEDNTISMHFRLGDYKDIQDHHPLLTPIYYKNALYEILGNYKIDNNVKVLYFCQKEDNEIVNDFINNIKKDLPRIKFEKVDDKFEDWKQMLLMSVCDHNIIANSTFSWWGAYFNKYENKIVCYPSVWFGHKMIKDVSDLFPKTWKCIAC